jgi:alcohol dehydrogenase class IV
VIGFYGTMAANQIGGNAMRFEFVTASRIVFGAGGAREIAPAATALGRRPLVVTGRHTQRAVWLLDHLSQQGLASTLLSVTGEPTIADVRAGVQRARTASCDMVIGLGGGSVLDAAKAIAALLTNHGDPLDYLEVVGRGQPLTQRSAPCIAVPTTAGTGSEVTRNAVLGSAEHRVKASLRSPSMLPKMAVVDPELTWSMPPDVTATTGLDALTQCLEPFVSRRANPLTDALCREGMQRAARSLRRAFVDGSDSVAREDMALASLLGGLALANAGLGAVHGFAGPIGGMFPAPHGAICARLLSPVMQANIQALQQRAPGSPALARYDEVARLFTGNPAARAAAGVAWVTDLVDALSIARLADHRIAPADFPEIVEKSQQASSMKANPIELTVVELTTILHQAL